MTFQEYIDNPMGKKSAVFSQREMYKDLYTKKYGAVLLRENGTFPTTMYYDKKNDRYFMHMKIPSETVNNFYYDVVVEFYPISPANDTDSTLSNYGVKFFSNDPSFMFTHNYVFAKYDLFIKELKPRASKIALKQRPEERNPYETPGYVKSIYFCFLHMKSRSLFNKAIWRTYAVPYKASELLKNVDSSDKKLEERRTLGQDQAKAKAKAKRDKLKMEEANKNQRHKTVKMKSGSVKTVVPKKPITGKAKITGTLSTRRNKK